MKQPDRHTLSVFGEALECASPDEQAAYLDRVCGQDSELRARVEGLLQAHEAAGGFLCGPSSADVPDSLVPEDVATAPEVPRERLGAVIGPYKLLEQIGEGAFGIVFLAEQQQPLRRKVALKVLKPGMDTRQVVARFEVERQALALMDHPNIARVFDGGSTASGRPYFVMELVKGGRITDFCDLNQLTVRQRLELFIHVCEAVQHAHQKGIIHRDLKPSNVLVSLHDDKAVVKVIDFGIAKATGQQLTDKTLFTNFAQMVGTPLYMSPEQAGQSGLDVDTRSDIYSLGVLLYELLTGTTPFDRERLRQVDYDELRRIIREEEPPRPSARISSISQTTPTVSANRQSDPKRLSQLFRGELDWIVMKALEKDRNRRYESANGLAMDVQHYLKDEPVEACPPSAWYRFRKFARRNKTALAVAALILFFIAVLGGGGGWILRDRVARQQRLSIQVKLILKDVERLERKQKWPEARAEAERAEAALAAGEVDDALRQRVAAARRDLAFVAQLDRIRQEVATIVEGGRFNDAGAARDYARAFREYQVDVEALSAAEAVARLRARPALAVPIAATLDDWVFVLQRLGEGAGKWKPLIAIAHGLDPDKLRDQLRFAWEQRVTPKFQTDLRQLAESIDVKALRPATLRVLSLTLIRARLGDAALRVLRDGQYAHPTDFWLNLDLGYHLYYRKDHAGAVRYFSVAVSIRPDSTAAHGSLGLALTEQKKLDEAIACYKKIIEELHPKSAKAHNNLGIALMAQGKLKEAIACYKKAIELDPKLAPPHNNLGIVRKRQGKLDEAITCYRRAIAADPKYALAYYNLGSALCKQTKLDEGIACYKKAIRLDPKSASAHYNLGIALRDQGRLNDAVTEYRKAIRLKMDHAAAHCNLGHVLRRQGKFREALAELRRGHELGLKDPRWRYPSSKWVRQCKRLIELDERLSDFLARKTTPASPKEAIELARVCGYKRLHRTAARFYEEAFSAEPKLLDQMGGIHRYGAACAAALAGCGQGTDTVKLDDKERARLRRQALDWLQADLAAWTKVLGRNTAAARAAVRAKMRHWQRNPDLAGVRGSEALARLPEAERQPWQKLWSDVVDILTRIKEKPNREKKSNAK